MTESWPQRPCQGKRETPWIHAQPRCGELVPRDPQQRIQWPPREDRRIWKIPGISWKKGWSNPFRGLKGVLAGEQQADQRRVRTRRMRWHAILVHDTIPEDCASSRRKTRAEFSNCRRDTGITKPPKVLPLTVPPCRSAGELIREIRRSSREQEGGNHFPLFHSTPGS